jgi:hypothetical protein
MNPFSIALFLSFVLLIVPLSFQRSKNKKLISYIPTFCTSIGVLCSFGLLWYALGYQEIQSDNLSETIKLLSSKFLFSIIGIGFSIGWTIYLKINEEWEDVIEKENNYWKKEDPQKLLWLLWQTGLGIERKFEVYAQSQNDNHADMRKSVKAGFTEIREQLMVLNSNSNELYEQLKVSNSHATLTKKAIEESSKVQSKKATEQQETLDNISNFMQSAGDSLKSLLDDLKNQLENNIKAMGSDAAEKAAELHRVFEGFLKDRASQMEENMANGMKEVHEKIHPALNSISEVTNNSANELKEALNGINSVLENMQISLARQINEQVQTAENNVENRTKKFEQMTTSKANELSTEFDKIHSVLQNLSSGLQSSIDGILKEKKEQIEKTFEHLEILRGRSETMLTQTTKEFALSVEKYGNIQHNNEEIIKRLETQIKSIDSLQETSVKNIDHWNSKVDKMEEVKNRVADIANTIGQLENINQKLGLLNNHNN